MYKIAKKKLKNIEDCFGGKKNMANKKKKKNTGNSRHKR